MRVEKNWAFDSDMSVSRADVFLSQKINSISRTALTGELCEIYINGKLSKKSDKVRPGDKVELFFAQDVFERVEPQDLPLEILYEDEDMLVINKAQGMVVHPGAGNPTGTVVNALAYRYGQSFIDNMADECDVSRPGIVHRLDKDTSGVMVIALNSRSHAALSLQFQNHTIEKHYKAFCDGVFNLNKAEIHCLMARDPNDRKLFTVSQTGGKDSISRYKVIRQFGNCALVDVRILTGRTHQIRVHMKSINHPVVGDVLYNRYLSKFPGQTLMLHSNTLDIVHPATGKEMHFEAPLPVRFEEFQSFLLK